MREGFGHLPKLLLPVVVFGIAFAVAGCGIWPVAQSTVSVGDTDIQVEHVVSKTVSSAQGGTLTVPEDESPLLAGLELEIPPGALSSDKRITIGKVVGGDAPSMPEGYQPLGYQFTLQPSGLSLEKPATIRFSINQNAKLYNEFRLVRYSKESQKWVSHASVSPSGSFSAQIQGFSLWEWVRFWKPSNPATQAKIMDRARQWLPSVTDSKLRTLLTKEFTTGVTYENAIGSLLLSEAMWNKISDGKYYNAVSLVEVARKELAQSTLEELAKRAAGVPSVSLAAQIAAFAIKVSLKTFMKQVANVGASNAQLRAYLSWRGWFFENGSWNYDADLAYDHSEVANGSVSVIQQSDSGWLIFRQEPGGTLEKRLFTVWSGSAPCRGRRSETGWPGESLPDCGSRGPGT